MGGLGNSSKGAGKQVNKSSSKNNNNSSNENRNTQQKGKGQAKGSTPKGGSSAKRQGRRERRRIDIFSGGGASSSPAFPVTPALGAGPSDHGYYADISAQGQAPDPHEGIRNVVTRLFSHTQCIFF